MSSVWKHGCIQAVLKVREMPRKAGFPATGAAFAKPSSAGDLAATHSIYLPLTGGRSVEPPRPFGVLRAPSRGRAFTGKDNDTA